LLLQNKRGGDVGVGRILENGDYTNAVDVRSSGTREPLRGFPCAGYGVGVGVSSSGKDVLVEEISYEAMFRGSMVAKEVFALDCRIIGGFATYLNRATHSASLCS